MRVEDVPVLCKIAHRVSQSVFAAEIGLPLRLRIVIAVANLPFKLRCFPKAIAGLPTLFKPVDERIHGRVYVSIAVSALEMDKTRWIESADFGHRLPESVSMPRLVSHRPENDAGVVPVEYGLPGVALDNDRIPLGLIAKPFFPVPVAMTLDVRLRHDINPIPVADNPPC